MQHTRRHFLKLAGATGVSATFANRLSTAVAADSFPKGKAESCIFIWLGGGACHVDMWDPKRRGDGKKVPGSYYDPIPTTIPGVSVCEHMKLTAPLLDRCVLLRTVFHDQTDHAAATNRLHTGRPTSGTVVYPSIGSIVAHERGAAQEGVPAYVVMGYPNVTRGPGFLGAKYGYIYLTDTEAGPSGLTRPVEVNNERQRRREMLLAKMRQSYQQRTGADEAVTNYNAAQAQGLQLAGPKFMSVFNLKSEPAPLREAYGGEFGQRCLLARRLAQAGVRFIEVSFNLNFVNGTGWDTHNEGQLKQHELIIELDRALAALIQDLEKQRMLDHTLIVVATEFGRPPEFDSGGGRGHQQEAFSIFMAGGGLKSAQVVGETNELGKKIISRPISVPDLHATIHCALGINPAKELYAGARPVPITDMGKPVRELFA